MKENYTYNYIQQLPKALGLWMLLVWSLCSFQLQAQGWEKAFGTPNAEEANAMTQTSDGGFIMAGYSGTDTYLLKTDVDGEELWAKTLGSPLVYDVAYDVITTTDGGYLLAGTIENIGNGQRDVYLIKTDQHGEVEWENYYGSGLDDLARSVEQTTDGGYIITGYTSIDATNENVFLIKTDANGQEEWTNSFGGNLDDRGYSVSQTDDGGYIITGYTEISSNYWTVYLVKTLPNGTEDWSTTFGSGSNNRGYDVIQTVDGGYAVVGFTATTTNGWDAFLIKTDVNGNSDWTKTYGGLLDDQGYSIAQTTDGGYIISGYTDASAFNGDVLLIKTFADGSQEWTRNFGRNGADAGWAVAQTENGGYAVAGSISKEDAIFDTDFYLLKTDIEGNTYSDYIEGNIFKDFNFDCQFDNGEESLTGWIVEAAGAQTFYGTSDLDGNYSILVDTGNYDVRVILPDYWAACVESFNINFFTFYDSTELNFAIRPETDCPLLEIDISTPLVRPCLDNKYVINYCNRGPKTAEDAYIEVNFDEAYTINSSTVPASSQDGNFYTFDVGDIASGDCGQINVNVTLDCNTTSGKTHCAEAHIYPDVLCLPVINWDSSSVVVDGLCDNDSVRFVISNLGTADMSQELEYIVIEDHVMYFPTPQPFQLETGESLNLAFPANGATYRIIAGQAEGHPGDSYPTLAIEGCATGGMPFSTGFYTEFPNDDNDPFVAIDCQENKDNYSPIEMRGYPKGYRDSLISNNTELEYLIHFQNVGVDEAFRVVIRDTISEYLDITTVRPGASSHPYDFKAYDNGILKFTFENIDLPDSSTDEVASHGFVKYRISQKLDNPDQTIIQNRAAIFFDYKTPENSNEVGVEVCEDIFNACLLVSSHDVFVPNAEISVYPNPFNEYAIFEIKGITLKNSSLNVYDLAGRLIRQQAFDNNSTQFYKNNLPQGMYVYKIEDGSQLISTGKLIIQ